MACPKVNYDQRFMSQFDPAITSEELLRRAEEHRQADILEAWALAKALADKLDDIGLYWNGDVPGLVVKLEGME